MATYGGRRLPSFLMEDKALATFGRRPPDSSNKPSETEMSVDDVMSADLLQLAIDSDPRNKRN
jgi:hypothetical protein